MAKIRQSATFREFDDYFTAPIHGFRNASDYMIKSSSNQFINKIKTPTLLITAGDDPFLSPSCYPTEEAEKSSVVTFLKTKYGGHVGFYQNNKNQQFYHIDKMLEFFQQNIR